MYRHGRCESVSYFGIRVMDVYGQIQRKLRHDCSPYYFANALNDNNKSEEKLGRSNYLDYLDYLDKLNLKEYKSQLHWSPSFNVRIRSANGCKKISRRSIGQRCFSDKLSCFENEVVRFVLRLQVPFEYRPYSENRERPVNDRSVYDEKRRGIVKRRASCTDGAWK